MDFIKQWLMNFLLVSAAVCVLLVIIMTVVLIGISPSENPIAYLILCIATGSLIYTVLSKK